MPKIDVVIILGGGVYPDGELGEHSKQRLDYFLENKDQFSAPAVILSGNFCGFKLFKPKQTEAMAMKKYLIKNKIPRDWLYLEERSRHTISNAVFSKKIIDKNMISGKKIALITSRWHLERAVFVFEKIFGTEYKFFPFGVPSKINEKAMVFENLQKLITKIILGLLSVFSLSKKIT